MTKEEIAKVELDKAYERLLKIQVWLSELGKLRMQKRSKIWIRQTNKLKIQTTTFKIQIWQIPAQRNLRGIMTKSR